MIESAKAAKAPVKQLKLAAAAVKLPAAPVVPAPGNSVPLQVKAVKPVDALQCPDDRGPSNGCEIQSNILPLAKPWTPVAVAGRLAEQCPAHLGHHEERFDNSQWMHQRQ